MGSPSRLQCVPVLNISPLNNFTAVLTIFMLVDETFLILCPYFDSPFKYPLNYDLLPQELFNLEAPHIQTPSLSQDLSPLGHPLNPFLGTPWGCPVRMLGDIVLYLIRILPTAQLLPKLRGHNLQIFTHFFIGLN